MDPAEIRFIRKIFNNEERLGDFEKNPLVPHPERAL
jgi:hypothetical protein